MSAFSGSEFSWHPLNFSHISLNSTQVSLLHTYIHTYGYGSISRMEMGIRYLVEKYTVCSLQMSDTDRKGQSITSTDFLNTLFKAIINWFAPWTYPWKLT